MSATFETNIHGKWILVGEHAVVRGVPAIAFPVYGKSLSLRWRAQDETGSSEFSARFAGDRGAEFQLLFSGVFDRALEILGRAGDATLRTGHFEVESTLPVGAGLGASAALAVAVGRWFVSRGAIEEAKLFGFCREIENLFHGESSGVDVAVALENRGLYFQNNQGERQGTSQGTSTMRGFDLAWQPIWYISSSGARGITSECVAKVKALGQENPRKGEELDRKMALAVQKAERVLCDASASEDERLEKLVEAIELAGDCFEEWGLSGGELGRHLQWLRDSGAIAVKPTGSGGGGYALSLWAKRPPSDIEAKLIPVFR
ncbi:MAG: hypothetical protein RBT63_04600 [Bdellovibrionales bacterium]|nr:hypothetical protein [Bdellovibrionales bacterium]